MDVPEETSISSTQSTVLSVQAGQATWNLVYMTWADLDHILIYILAPSMALAILGIGTNILNIIVFVKMGLHETTTISMLALAVSDLTCSVLTVWVVLCFIPEFRDMPNLPFVPTEISPALGGSFRVYVTRTGGMITAFITLERCLCVVIPVKVKTFITVTVTRAVVIIIYIITVLPSFAYVFWDVVTWKYYPHLNKTLLGLVHQNKPTVTLVNQINGFVCGFGYLFISSLILLVCTMFFISVLTRSSKWRDNFHSKSTSVQPECGSSTRELRLIKLVATLATIFILAMLPGMCILCVSASLPIEFSLRGPLAPFSVFSTFVANLTETANSCVNFFVYYTMGAKFKVTCNRIVRLKREELPHTLD